MCIRDRYCAFLKTPQAASKQPELINAVTTNHTAFYRERHHFDHLRKDVMPRLVQERLSRRGRIRIWSAACSSGEEPYSIAASCREALGHRNDVDFKILATDNDTDILAPAEARMYPAELIDRLTACSKALTQRDGAGGGGVAMGRAARRRAAGRPPRVRRARLRVQGGRSR